MTFEEYAASTTITGKNGDTIPFILNKYQRRLDELLNKQREVTGKVRVVILKYSQTGAKTYVRARHQYLSSLSGDVNAGELLYISGETLMADTTGSLEVILAVPDGAGTEVIVDITLPRGESLKVIDFLVSKGYRVIFLPFGGYLPWEIGE